MRYLNLYLILSLLLCASCIPKFGARESDAPVPMAPSPEEETEQEQEPALTLPKLRFQTSRARDYVRAAIRLLQTGEEQDARSKLLAALRDDPSSRIAERLLRQIDTDPVEYLGAEYFLYEVQSGDSLSGIAERFLDDPLEFYILARYNNIEKPDRLKAGQGIKVPKRAMVPQPVAPEERELLQNVAEPVAIPAPKTHEKVEVTPPAAPGLEEKASVEYVAAKQLYDAGKYQEAMDVLERVMHGTEGPINVRDLLVRTYSEYADVFLDNEEFLEARKLLQKAVTIRPEDKGLQKRLINVENELEAKRLYENGLDAFKAGYPDKAYEAFLQVMNLKPDHTLAREQVAKIKPAVVDFYHEKAMLAYRHQELDEAIAAWDKVLELDPDYELAKLHRARALELKEKLKSLEMERGRAETE